MASKKLTKNQVEKKAIKEANRHAKKRKEKIRKILLSIAIMVGLVSVSAVGLSAYRDSWAEERDLSVIGNGDLVIVQVHDNGCALCRKLKSNTEDVLSEFDDEIKYKIADINTSAGKKFQRQHDVPHVTLLFFDRRGKLWTNLNGVKSTDELRGQFKEFVATAK